MTAPRRLSPDQAKFLDNQGLQRIFDLVEGAGGEARINGGAVRNALLGEAVGDIDLSTTLSPEHVTECLQRGGVKVVPTGIEHGTVTAIADAIAYEITTLRQDIETDGRRATVRFGTDWLADAQRRDFTLNAMYCDRHGSIFDPLGGYADLMARRIRFIGDPRSRIKEDRLRILRFFRMFAWYGSGRPDSEALKACVRARDGILQLSPERVWQELKKLLAAPDPVRSLLWMRTSGILSLALPESEKWGMDNLAAAVALTASGEDANDPMIRLMAMIPPRSERIDSLAARLRLSGTEHDRLTAWANAGTVTAQLPSAANGRFRLDLLLYRCGRRATVDFLIQRLAARNTAGADAAETGSSQGDITRDLDLARTVPVPEFPVRGRDLIERGHAPGPELGRILGELEQIWIESGFDLDREALLLTPGTEREP